IRKALDEFGINWPPARIAWDGFNPHPDMADLPRETVFVGYGNGNQDAFNRHNVVTAGLQEVLLLYPGYLLPANESNFSFEPLLQTGRLSGTSTFFDLVQPTPNGMVLNPSVQRETDGRQYVLAARVRSQKTLSSAPGARPMDLLAVA